MAEHNAGVPHDVDACRLEHDADPLGTRPGEQLSELAVLLGVYATSIVGCARCDDAHDDLTFRPLTRPVVLEDELGEPWTHWATCPTTGEPILGRRRVRDAGD